jgi:hypothetical protein
MPVEDKVIRHIGKKKAVEKVGSPVPGWLLATSFVAGLTGIIEEG